MTNVVHFPRHLATPPSRELSITECMERKYERTFKEPWSELEDRVRTRHPELFEMLDTIDLSKPHRPWWQFWSRP